jgi:hypothetical protein
MDDDILNSNYDDVFFRDVLASVSYFMYDTISIKRTVNEKDEIIRVPIYPSSGMSENFIKDFFVNRSKDCEHPVTNNLVHNILPSGRILVDDSLSIDSMSVLNNNVRSIRNTQVSNDFFNTFQETYGRRTILGIKMSFVVSIKCTSLLERFKILERIMTYFYKNRVFYFSSNGIDKIPATMSVSDNVNLSTLKAFKFGNVDKKYILDVSFTVNTYLVIDNNRENLTDDQKNGVEANISLIN